jgi:hypothetical protein
MFDGPHGHAGDRLVEPLDILETTKVGEHRGEIICDVARDGVIGPGNIYIIYIYIYMYIYISYTHIHFLSGYMTRLARMRICNNANLDEVPLKVATLPKVRLVPLRSWDNQTSVHYIWEVLR